MIRHDDDMYTESNMTVFCLYRTKTQRASMEYKATSMKTKLYMNLTNTIEINEHYRSLKKEAAFVPRWRWRQTDYVLSF